MQLNWSINKQKQISFQTINNFDNLYIKKIQNSIQIELVNIFNENKIVLNNKKIINNIDDIREILNQCFKIAATLKKVVYINIEWFYFKINDICIPKWTDVDDFIFDIYVDKLLEDEDII